MALVKCPECGTSVSEFAQSCPKCGIAVAQEIEKNRLKKLLQAAKEERGRCSVEVSPLQSRLSYCESSIRNLEHRKDYLVNEKNRGTGVTKPASFWYVIGGILLFLLGLFELVAVIEDMPLLAIVGGISCGCFGYALISRYFDDRKNKSKYASISAERLKDIETKLSSIDKELPELQKEANELKRQIIPVKQKLDRAENKVREIEEKIKNIGNNTSHTSSAPLDNKPRCPTCRSEKIERISELERYVDSTGFGTIAGGGLNSPSLGKTFKCNNCGYRW